MKLFNTQTKQDYILDKNKISIYLCGVTVYDESHVGHLRTIIIFDVLRRYLESHKIETILIQNFTDIDDKIINRSEQESISALELAEKYIQSYLKCSDAFNIKRATKYPRATDHMNDMIIMISDLIEKDFAYITKTGVYYAVSKFIDYGQLSGKKITELEAGSRVNIDPTKQHPLDFALWKLSDKTPFWSSPWGNGRPGWHIECSTMALKYLGKNFDIHGGGRDLIFPHHENEIAQTKIATNEPLAKCWTHVGMVTLDGEKMSKSIGNTKTAINALNDWGPNVIRLFCISGNYAKPIDYTQKALLECLTKWRQVETAYHECLYTTSNNDSQNFIQILNSCKQKFQTSLDDNLNTHLALSALFTLSDEIKKITATNSLSKSDAQIALELLKYMLNVLGLYVNIISESERKIVLELLSKRKYLRENKQYQEADKIRDDIIKMGIEILDRDSSTIWIKHELVNSENSI